MLEKESRWGFCVCIFIVLSGCAGTPFREVKTGPLEVPEYCSESGQVPSKTDPQAGILLFEDFEKEEYQKDWTVHWGKPVGAGTVSVPSQYVFAGNHSAYVESQKGRHDSLGAGEYVLEPPLDDRVYLRMSLRLDDGFSIGTANQLKLFGIRGGARIEDTYGGAGKKPNGTDKFSVTLGLDKWMKLHFYIYHPDQKVGWGDFVYCNISFFRKAGLSPGKWYSVQLMLKNNTPGTRNGQVAVWLDGQLVGKVDRLRFRDVDTVKIRRITMEDYFGGDSVRDTSPKDQRLYIDNVVVSTSPVGCFRGTSLSGGGNPR